MKHILEDLLSRDDFLEAKKLLYDIRKLRGYEDYCLFKRILYVAANFAGKWKFFDFRIVLSMVSKWLSSGQDSIYFSEFDYRLAVDDTYFMVKVDTILFKSWNALVNETKLGVEEMNYKIRNGIIV